MYSVKTPMSIHEAEFSLGRLKTYIGFKEDDLVELQTAKKAVLENTETILDKFYDQVLDNGIASGILKGAGSSVNQLKATLKIWLSDLFSCPLDEAYFKKQQSIGTRHIEIELPQPFMVLGMNVIRATVTDELIRFFKDDPKKMLRACHALNGLLDLSLAIILQSYQTSRETLLEENINQENEYIMTIGRMSTSIAHEIKNPLAGIRGAVEVMRDALPEDDENKKVMGAILGQTQRLTGTVTDLLQFARPVKANIQDTPLSKILESTKLLLKNDPDYKEVVIETDSALSQAVLRVDPILIQDVFWNLFSNACHAMNGKGRIRVHAESQKEQIALFVQDEGPGIPDDWKDKIFSPFATNKTHGTGLGLPICKKIVESHGGRLSLMPSDHGTLFRFTLPGYLP